MAVMWDYSVKGLDAGGSTSNQCGVIGSNFALSGVIGRVNGKEVIVGKFFAMTFWIVGM